MSLDKMSNQGSSTGIPSKSLHLIAEQMGVDFSELGGQAEQVWSMLNDLRDSNIDAYYAFIQKQMEASKTELSNKAIAYFTPKKGFVVKTKSKAGSSVFVNFCHHHAIQKPLDGDGKPINEKRVDISDLQIPLVVSDVRNLVDALGKNANAVDVVVHPWCMLTCNNNNIFKSNLVELGLTWVKKEHSFSLDDQWKIIKSQYKGGIGGTKRGVHSFPISDNMLNRKSVKEPKREGMREQNPIRNPKEKEKSVNGVDITGTPADLLNKLRQRQDTDTLFQPDENSNTESFGSTLKSRVKPIIEEIPASSLPVLSEKPDDVENREHDHSKQKKPTSLKSQMKGFFENNKVNHKPLYTNGSPGDGLSGTGGSYSKFMAKCKVIDTSELQGPSTIKQNGSKKERGCRKERKPFQSFPRKGFLNNPNNLGVSEENERAGEFDAEFHDIMNHTDPDFATHCKDPRKDSEQNNKGGDIVMNLAHLSSIIAGEGREEDTKAEREDLCHIKKEQIAAEEKNLRTSSSNQQLPFEFIEKGKDKIIEIDLSGVKVTSLDMLNLEVSGSTIRLKTACKKVFHYETEKIDTGRIKARFVQKKRKMKIYL
mmetsp:Transcript_23325/g.34400  ORF Transcript_23325/g.34400 Transcript_23325/m.34400 type:complete len:595 (-) Transcript_23325:56-1840(-)